MQTQTDDIFAEFESAISLKYHVRCFELFEEFNHEDIVVTIKNRREIHEKADPQTWKEIEAKVNAEISDFRTWLESAKEFAPQVAHYHSISLKSLLIGLPTGVRVAQLFSSILEDI